MLHVFTDGSHVKGTDVRGYSAYARWHNRTHELSVNTNSDARAVSNPTLEMRAAAHVLEDLHDRLPADVDGIMIVSDLELVYLYATGVYRPKRRGAAGKSEHFHVETRRLVAVQQRYAERYGSGFLTFRHIRGHTKLSDDMPPEQRELVLGNAQADALAKSNVNRNTFDTLE